MVGTSVDQLALEVRYKYCYQQAITYVRKEHSKHLIAETCSRSPVKTMNLAYNKNCKGDDLFSVGSKLRFVQVLEACILRHSKKVFHYVQVPFKTVFTVYVYFQLMHCSLQGFLCGLG
jgi:hypothetical protein